MNWVKGIPEEAGIYWYNSGFGHSEKPSVLQVTKYYKYVFGDYGSMPLSSVYSESRVDKVFHSLIPRTENWEELKCISGRTKAWVLTAAGYLGFGLLRPDLAVGVCAD